MDPGVVEGSHHAFLRGKTMMRETTTTIVNTSADGSPLNHPFWSVVASQKGREGKLKRNIVLIHFHQEWDPYSASNALAAVMH